MVLTWMSPVIPYIPHCNLALIKAHLGSHCQILTKVMYSCLKAYL